MNKNLEKFSEKYLINFCYKYLNTRKKLYNFFSFIRHFLFLFIIFILFLFTYIDIFSNFWENIIISLLVIYTFYKSSGHFLDNGFNIRKAIYYTLFMPIYETEWYISSKNILKKEEINEYGIKLFKITYLDGTKTIVMENGKKHSLNQAADIAYTHIGTLEQFYIFGEEINEDEFEEKRIEMIKKLKLKEKINEF